MRKVGDCMGAFLALAAAFFFGLSNIYTRKGLEESGLEKEIGLLVTVVVNNLINAMVLLTYLVLGGFRLPPINWAGVAAFTGAGVLTSFSGRFLLFAATERLGPSRSGALKVTAPVVTVALGIFLLGEALPPLAWLGVAAVLLGVFLVSQDSREQGRRLAVAAAAEAEAEGTGRVAGRDTYVAWGIGLALLSSLSFGGGNILRKLGVSFFPSPIWGVIGVAIGSLVALLCLGSLLLAQGRGREVAAAVRGLARSPYLHAGWQTSMGLYSTFFALDVMPVSLANSITAVEPMFTVALGQFLLQQREILSLRSVVGAAVVSGGVAILFLVS